MSRLPLFLNTFDAHRTLVSVSRTLRTRAGADDTSRAIAALCQQASQSFGQATAGVYGAARRWHGHAVAVPAALLAAGAAGAALAPTDLWTPLVLALAIVAAVAAQYWTTKAWTRWRFRRAVAVLNTCHPRAELRTEPTAKLLADARAAVAGAKTAILADAGAAKSFVTWHPLRGTRVEDSVFDAFTKVAKAEQAHHDPDVFAKWANITGATAAGRGFALELIAIRGRLWSVMDDLRRRAYPRELAGAHADLMDAWDITGRTVTGLGVDQPLLGPRQLAAHALQTVPGFAGAVAAGLVVAPLVPVPVAAVVVVAAMLAVDQGWLAIRAATSRPTPAAARLAALRRMETWEEVDELRGLWVDGIGAAIDELETLGNQLVGDPDGTLSDAEFDATVADLPDWQRLTVVNLGLAIEHLDRARHEVKGWSLL